MKALYNIRRGGYEVLQVRETPDLRPRPGEVLIQVTRAGLNFADVMARMGLYPEAPPAPFVMGYEVSGTVATLGADVSTFKEGDRVLALTHFGGQASQVSVPAAGVFRLPEQMGFDEAAALPVVYLTAHHLLHRVRRVQPGDRVLVHAAAGGVGLAVIQLCRAIGGVELFGTASKGKHAFLHDAGLTHAIDYRDMDYEAEVQRLSAGRGLDLVLDPLGGESWQKGYRLLAPGGLLIAYGFSRAVGGERRGIWRALRAWLAVRRYSPLSLMADNRGLAGVNMLKLFDDTALLRRTMSELFSLYEQHKLAPHVDRVFPLSQAADAHRHLQEGRSVGKVLFDCT